MIDMRPIQIAVAQNVLAHLHAIEARQVSPIYDEEAGGPVDYRVFQNPLTVDDQALKEAAIGCLIQYLSVDGQENNPLLAEGAAASDEQAYMMQMYMRRPDGAMHPAGPVTAMNASMLRALATQLDELNKGTDVHTGTA